MRVGLLTREYPPEVYGGAGVHADFLARHLRRLIDLTVVCQGAPRDTAVAVPGWDRLAGANASLQTMAMDLVMADAVTGMDLVHSHTWYANFAGHIAKLLHGIPHVVTTHSLEPLRPWKAEQLGGGYALSCFCERVALEHADAVIAVSAAMRDDVLRCYPAIDPDRVQVLHNGIDTELYAPAEATDVLVREGIDPHRPSVLFVGRITRQKGLVHLLRAAEHLAPDVQLVLAAGAPDTPAIEAEVAGLVESLRARRDGVIWVRDMLPVAELLQLLTHADVFVCPSVYEPMGIVNLEAMACCTAVVATATGGIPEVVEDGATGLLVPITPRDDGTGEPTDPQAFARDLAAALQQLLDDPARATAMGEAGRRRAVELFDWAAIAQRTVELYSSLL